MMAESLSLFQKILKYNFKNQNYLIEALTHKSFSVEANRAKPHNERLEFLGDSILNFVVAEKLILMYANVAEGSLSKKRASLVNLNKLAEVAQQFKLEDHIYFGPGEIKQGNHLNSRIQGSCIEALIGAIYLDSDFNTVKNWVLEIFHENDFVLEDESGFGSDFKSRLQELTQKHKLGMPAYELVMTTGPSHKPNFLVAIKINNEEKSRATGPSKKMAEQRAAEMCLTELTKTLKE